ncbi:MAG: hypothetical protein DRN96_06590 [Thermoproteota archaeon]|nr:MAG: hypothetical protein DRN96_06590 [Candidatus Korarchaeota archaeon]
MKDTPIYLFDEPTAGLSAEAVRAVHDFVQEELVKKRGALVLYAANNVIEAERICRRVSYWIGSVS